MNHLSQEDLVLFYYGELDKAGEHLNACEECRRDYQAVQRTLNAVDSLPVPERGQDYEKLVWQRSGPRLPVRPKRSFWWTVPKWAIAAVLVIGAFLLGRVAPRPGVPAAVPGGSNRVLLVAVGDHLERSKMVLAELVNSGDPGQGTLDISYEQKVAEDLVESNRLFRLSANTSGDRATASLLDDLERVLLEIAHSPTQVSGRQFEELKRDIQDQGLLFKVRVYQTQIRERDKKI